MKFKGHIKDMAVKVDGNTSDTGIYIHVKINHSDKEPVDLQGLGSLIKKHLAFEVHPLQMEFGKIAGAKKDKEPATAPE